MADSIKWSGIEQTKYGLTARWYVSAYYGNDVDVDGVGYYNPSTNVNGHGGPTRPLASLSKVNQDANITANTVLVIDSGYYSVASFTKPIVMVGDGVVNIAASAIGNNSNSDSRFFNIRLLNCTLGSITTILAFTDCKCIYGSQRARDGISVNLNCEFIEHTFVRHEATTIKNCVYTNCTGFLGNAAFTSKIENIFISNSPNLTIRQTTPRPSGVYMDYSVIIGTVKSNRVINGKTTGVTVEDFKADGNYFVKSYSEVDLFGNPSGSGATVPQLQTLFNNYFSPVYIDAWQDLDLSLKPTASNMIKFGGLNGTYIGALPVGHYFSGETLWNTYKDAVNTSNIDYDMLSKGLVITPGQEFGTFRSTRISLGAPYFLEPINFFANLVYNSDGTPRQGVSNQRIDTTPDDLPDNTKNQRVVYDFKLQYSETVGGALTPFLNFELNRTPEIDNSGRSNIDAVFVALERKKIKVADFIIELTLRRIIIE